MVIGTTLMKLDGGGGVYYSPTFARGGLSATFLAQILNVTTDGELDIDIEHKNESDTSFSLLVSFGTPGDTAGQLMSQDATGLKEQIRLKYTVSGTNEYDAVHVLVLTPNWRPY